MTGQEPEQIAGSRMLTTFPGHHPGGPFFDMYARVANTGGSEQVTDYYQDDRGLEAWYEVSAVKNGDDGIVVTFINVTERMQSLAQLKLLLQQLQRSNESLDQFAAVASHDLQEPLRKIKSFGDLLLDRHAPALGDDAALLRRMQAAAERMQTLIRDLLALSRLSKGDGPAGGEIPRKPVDLNRIVGEVLIDLELVVQEKKAMVDVGILPTLPGDALQLRQLMHNLLSNALKFTRPGQPPRVSLSSERRKRSELPAEVSLPGKPGQTYWQITVADNGIGFSDAYREKIFGAFERLHGRNSPFGGSGIGLAIVRKVMDNHHGAVIAHSIEGEGATFILYFPATDNFTQS